MQSDPEDLFDSYLDSLERLLFATSGSSIFDVDFEGIEEAFNRIWNDIDNGYHRIGPAEIVQVQIPSLVELQARFAAEESARAATNAGSGFTPIAFWEKFTHWVGNRKCLMIGVILGLTWLAYKRRRRVGYLSKRMRRHLMKKELAPRKSKPSIFIVGGSHPIAPLLISRLEILGFSVFSDATYPFVRSIYENESQPEGDFYRTLLKDALGQHSDLSSADTVHSIISLSHLSPLVDSNTPSEVHESTANSHSIKLPPASSYVSYLNNTSLIPSRRLFDIIDVLFTHSQAEVDNDTTKRKKSITVCVPSASYAPSAATSRSTDILRKTSAAATLAAMGELRAFISSPDAAQRYGPTSVRTVLVEMDLSDSNSIPSEDAERLVSLITRTIPSAMLVQANLGGSRASLRGCVTSVGLRARMVPFVFLDWWRGDHLFFGPSRIGHIKSYAINIATSCEEYAKGVVIYVAKILIYGLRTVLEWVDDHEELGLEDNDEPFMDAKTAPTNGNSEEQMSPRNFESSSPRRSSFSTPDLLTGEEAAQSYTLNDDAQFFQQSITPDEENKAFMKRPKSQKVYDKSAQVGTVSEQVTTSIERLRAMTRSMTETVGRTSQVTLGNISPVNEDGSKMIDEYHHHAEDEDDSAEVASSWISLSEDEKHE